jgi:hypothetical protein
MHDDGAAKAAPFASLTFLAEDRMPTRRDFALTVGAAALGACVRAPSVPPAPVLPAPATSPTSADADANAPLTDAMTQLVRHRYGTHLSDEQMARVRNDIRDGLRASDRLRVILLPNATEPDVVFAVHRGGDR